MAYRNLVLQDCASKGEVFARIRDFICARAGTYDYSTTGIGWTLIDSSYVVDENNPELGDWFVMTSPGEGGKERMCFQFKWGQANNLSVHGFLKWDAILHSGVIPFQTSLTTFPVADGLSAYDLSVYGDLDSVICLEKISYTAPVKVQFGRLAGTIYDSDPNISVNSATAGINVVVTLDRVPADWDVGTRVAVLDDAKINIETIKGISGLDVTLDLTNSYAAGFSMQGSIEYFASNIYYQNSVDIIFGHDGITDKALAYESSGATIKATPDLMNNDYVGARVYQAATGTMGGYLPHIVVLPSTGLVQDDLLIGAENYRFFSTYSATYIAVKEV